MLNMAHTAPLVWMMLVSSMAGFASPYGQGNGSIRTWTCAFRLAINHRGVPAPQATTSVLAPSRRGHAPRLNQRPLRRSI